MRNKEHRLSETGWFPHDTDAITDQKIAALLQDFKAEGYGIFWHLTELMHAEKTGCLPYSNVTFKAIARNMSSSPELIKSIVDNCLNEYELYNREGDYFTSKRVQKNLQARRESTQKRAEAGRKGGQKTASNATAKVQQSNGKGAAKGSTVQYSTVHTPLQGVYVLDKVAVSGGSATPSPHPLVGVVYGWPFKSEAEKAQALQLLGSIEFSDQETAEAISADLEDNAPAEMGIIEFLKAHQPIEP